MVAVRIPNSRYGLLDVEKLCKFHPQRRLGLMSPDRWNRVTHPHHHVACYKIKPAGTEQFADQALDGIAIDCAPDKPLADHHPQPRMTWNLRTEHLEMRTYRDGPRAQCTRKLGGKA